MVNTMTNYESIIKAMNELHDDKAVKTFQHFMRCEYCPIWMQCHKHLLKTGVDVCCEDSENLEAEEIKKGFSEMSVEDMACIMTIDNEKAGVPNTGDYFYDETIFNFLHKKEDKINIDKILKFYKF